MPDYVDIKGLRKVSGDQINPATEDRQSELLDRVGEANATPAANTLLDRLKKIYEAVDELELSVDNINLNTDELEGLIQATNDAVASLEAANDLSGDDIVSAVNSCKTTLNATINSLRSSNELHSDEEQAILSSVIDAVQAFNLSFDSRDLSTKAKQDEQLARFGEVVENPTQNTLLARIKQINDNLNNQSNPARKDVNNSTNTALGLGESFIGEWTESTNINSISFFAFADQPFDVARLEWSSDGVNINTDLLATADYLVSEENTDGFFVYYPDPQTYLLDKYFRVVLEKTTGTAQTLMSAYMWTFSSGAQPFTFLDPEGVPSTLSKALLTKTINPALVIAQYTDETDGVIPSGNTPLIDPVLNTEPNVLDTGWISTESFAGKNVVNAVTDEAVDVYLMNASDDQGANIFGDEFPTFTSLSGSARQLSALYADNFFRMLIVNRSGNPLDDYSIRVSAAPESTDGVTTSIDADIFGFFPAKVTRTVGVGKNPDGIFTNLESPGFYSEQSSSTPRAAGVPFEPTTWSAVNGYGSQQFAVFTNSVLDDTYYTAVNGQQGAVLLEVSNDGINKTTDFILTLGSNPPAETAMFTIAFPYFRIKVAPHNASEAFFVVNVVSYSGAPTAPIRAIDSKFNGRGLAATSRSVIFGRPETGDPDPFFEPVNTDGKGRLLTNGGSRFTRLLNRQVENDEVIRTDVEPTTKLTRVEANCNTTAGSSTVTCPTASYSDVDLGAFITNANLPPRTYITNVVSSTEIEVSANALVTGAADSTIEKSAFIIATASATASMTDPVWRMVLIGLSPTRNPDVFLYREDVKYSERLLGWN